MNAILFFQKTKKSAITPLLPGPFGSRLSTRPTQRSPSGVRVPVTVKKQPQTQQGTLVNTSLKLSYPFLEPTCANAWWAHMHCFLSVCLCEISRN